MLNNIIFYLLCQLRSVYVCVALELIWNRLYIIICNNWVILLLNARVGSYIAISVKQLIYKPDVAVRSCGSAMRNTLHLAHLMAWCDIECKFYFGMTLQYFCNLNFHVMRFIAFTTTLRQKNTLWINKVNEY